MTERVWTLNWESGFETLNDKVAWTPNWESGSEQWIKKVALNA